MPKTPDLEKLQSRLGYTFKDIGILVLALTHSSVRSLKGQCEDNERLEFLGDRVLGLAIAELLKKRFPAAKEGDLARRLNRLVRAETCAQIARRVGLGEFIIMSAGEEESGGRDKQSILANACEAILGAMFKDGGYEQAREFIFEYWEPISSDDEETPIDPKSALQEWAMSQKLDLPKYRQISRRGPDHKPHFVTEVSVNGLDPVRGEGSNKRASEQNAAERMLIRERIWASESNE